MDKIPLRISEKQFYMVIASTIAFFLYGLTISTIEKAIISSAEVTAQLIASQVWLPSVALLLVTLLWQFIKKFMIKYYAIIEIIETVVSITMTVIVCIHWNPIIYFLTRLILGSLVDVVLGETAMNFRDYLFTTGKERTRCRQEQTLYKGTALVTAGFLAQMVVITPEAAIVLMLIGDCIRTAGAIYTFKIQHKYLTDKIVKD